MPSKAKKKKKPAAKRKKPAAAAASKRKKSPNLDERFVLSFLPSELRDEAKRMLSANKNDEVAKFWASADMSDLIDLAHNIMWDERLWDARREAIRNAMMEVRDEINVVEALNGLE